MFRPCFTNGHGILKSMDERSLWIVIEFLEGAGVRAIGEGKSSKHPIPPYPPTWESVGFGLTLQQLAFELAHHDTTVGSFTSVRLLGVTKILGQKSYCFVTHSWTLHRPQDHQKQPSPMSEKGRVHH